MAGVCQTCSSALAADSSTAGLCPSCLFAQVVAEPDPFLSEERDLDGLAPGSQFGPFQIRGVLGLGGMSTVYEAYEPALERIVALKVLPPEFLHDSTFARRFHQEARVVAALEHRHIVPLYASGIEDGVPWMSMRLLTGGNLGTLIANRRLDFGEALAILREVASALDWAHARGIVHRDIKPSNILMDDERRVCVGDFGLAQLVERGVAQTRAGVFAGTPHYMAPETGSGAKADPRTDVYSLGVVAFEMLTGHPPFDAPSPIAILLKHARDPMPEPEGDHIPGAVANVLRKALAKDPADRWPSASGFVDALEAQVAAPVSHWPSRRQVTAGSSVVGIGVVLTLLFWRPIDTTTERSADPSAVRSQVASVSSPVLAQTDRNPASLEDTTTGKVSTSVNPIPPASRPEGNASSGLPEPGHASTPDPSAVAPTPIAPPAADTLTRAAPTTVEPADAVREPAARSAEPVSIPPPPPQPDVIIRPLRIKAVDAVYPPLARADGLEGDVMLQAMVEADGRVTQVKIVRSAHPLLDKAALDAFRQWQYRPGLRNGEPSALTVQETVSFRLRK